MNSELERDDGLITVQDCIRWLDTKYSRHGELEDKAAADYLRAALSSEAQPEVTGAVATVYVGENDFGPFDFKVTPYGCDKLPEGETKLYATTQRLTDTVTISSQEYEALKADKVSNCGKFNYVDIVGSGYEGYINLFWGDYIIQLVPPYIAAEIKDFIDGADETSIKLGIADEMSKAIIDLLKYKKLTPELIERLEGAVNAYNY